MEKLARIEKLKELNNQLHVNSIDYTFHDKTIRILNSYLEWEFKNFSESELYKKLKQIITDSSIKIKQNTSTISKNSNHGEMCRTIMFILNQYMYTPAFDRLQTIHEIIVGKWHTSFGLMDIKAGKTINQNTISGKVHNQVEDSEAPIDILDYSLKLDNNQILFVYNGLSYIVDLRNLDYNDLLILTEVQTDFALILHKNSN